MPDSFDAGRKQDAPQNWTEAFAGLGLETPPADGWRRFELALEQRSRQHQAPRRERRASWLVALASAAVLAVAVWAPQLAWRASTTQTPEGVAAGATAPPASARQAPQAARSAESTPVVERDAPAPETTQLRMAQRALPGLERPAPVRPRSAAVDRTHARQATDTLISSLPLPAATEAYAQVQAAAQLPALQQQSRQFEALIQLTRDERVSSAAGAVITSELDATLAQVDADLGQPDLDATRRLALWRERVQLLERLAGVASTERWLAAHGERFDALVAVD